MGYSPRPRRYAMPKRHARLVSGGGSAMGQYRKALSRELKLINSGSDWRVSAVKLARGVNNFPLFSLRVVNKDGAKYGFVLEPRDYGNPKQAQWLLQEVSACCGVKNAATASSLESSDGLRDACCEGVVSYVPAPHTMNAKYLNLNLGSARAMGLNEVGMVSLALVHTRGKMSALTDLLAARFAHVEPNLLEAQMGASTIAEAIFTLVRAVDADPFTATSVLFGAMGSGKSTAMASLINQLNAGNKQSGKTVKIHTRSSNLNPLQGP